TGMPYMSPNGMIIPEWVLRGLPDPSFTIPWSYDSHDVGIDADGDLFWGLRLATSFHYEHREYADGVTITPDPGLGYHRQRIDDRFTFELALRRELGAGIWLRLTGYFQLNLSTIDLMDTRFDYDDFNYTRFVGTVDLLRPF